MEERRSEIRMMCADMVAVSWKAGGGRTQHAMALLEDISASGACLQLEAAIPIGAEIGWKCPRQQFSGHVRYCVYREIGYFIGVSFDAQTRWSKKTYKPRHLLDLQAMVRQAAE